jgi:hypothetical protein
LFFTGPSLLSADQRIIATSASTAAFVFNFWRLHHWLFTNPPIARRSQSLAQTKVRRFLLTARNRMTGATNSEVPDSGYSCPDPKAERERQLSFIGLVTSRLIVITGARNTGRGRPTRRAGGVDRLTRPSRCSVFFHFPLSHASLTRQKRPAGLTFLPPSSFIFRNGKIGGNLPISVRNFRHAPADHKLTPHAVKENEEKIKTVSFFSGGRTFTLQSRTHPPRYTHELLLVGRKPELYPFLPS